MRSALGIQLPRAFGGSCGGGTASAPGLRARFHISGLRALRSCRGGGASVIREEVDRSPPLRICFPELNSVLLSVLRDNLLGAKRRPALGIRSGLILRRLSRFGLRSGDSLCPLRRVPELLPLLRIPRGILLGFLPLLFGGAVDAALVVVYCPDGYLVGARLLVELIADSLKTLIIPVIVLVAVDARKGHDILHIGEFIHPVPVAVIKAEIHILKIRHKPAVRLIPVLPCRRIVFSEHPSTGDGEPLCHVERTDAGELIDLRDIAGILGHKLSIDLPRVGVQNIRLIRPLRVEIGEIQLVHRSLKAGVLRGGLSHCLLRSRALRRKLCLILRGKRRGSGGSGNRRIGPGKKAGEKPEGTHQSRHRPLTSKNAPKLFPLIPLSQTHDILLSFCKSSSK